MLPVLLSIGPISVRTLTIVLILAVFSSAFVYWKKATEEHYDEVEAFDGWILASVMGLIGARIGGFIWQWLSLADLTAWYSAWSAVRYQAFVGVLVGGLTLLHFAAQRKWDVWEILDYWSLSLCWGWAVMWIGLFFDGTSIGSPTNLPWGVRFTSLFTAVHPVQLYFSLAFFLLFGYLNWAEYHYRTFSWYRSGKNTAQSGYLISIFTIAAGCISLIMTTVRPAQFQFGPFAVDVLIYGFVLLLGVWMLIRRSGRTLAWPSLGKRNA